MMGITRGGTILAAVFEGLSSSTSAGCDWAFYPPLKGKYVVDLAVDKVDPTNAVLIVSNSAGGSLFLTQLWETNDAAKYPLQMISTHSRYSFHTYGDGKNSTLNDIDDHRVDVGGYYYWVMRVNSLDAKARGIKHHDLIRVFNDRGSVICAADVSPLVALGVCKSYESSAEVDFVEDPRFGLVDRGGCVNVLTPRRPQVKNTDGMGSNSCLVELEAWVPSVIELKRA